MASKEKEQPEKHREIDKSEMPSLLAARHQREKEPLTREKIREAEIKEYPPRGVKPHSIKDPHPQAENHDVKPEHDMEKAEDFRQKVYSGQVSQIERDDGALVTPLRDNPYADRVLFMLSTVGEHVVDDSVQSKWFCSQCEHYDCEETDEK